VIRVIDSMNSQITNFAFRLISLFGTHVELVFLTNTYIKMLTAIVANDNMV